MEDETKDRQMSETVASLYLHRNRFIWSNIASSGSSYLLSIPLATGAFLIDIFGDVLD